MANRLARLVALLALSLSSAALACGSSSTGSGASSSSGASGASGSSSGASSGSPGALNAPSTLEERNALCNAGVPKCQSYVTVGACIEDQQAVAGCFARTVLDCVKKLASCGTDDYDACMIEGAHACDPVAIPSYVTACRDKNASCKPQYPAARADDVARTVDDSCFLLPGLDDSGRAKGASCVAGPCGAIEKCLTELTP